MGNARTGLTQGKRYRINLASGLSTGGGGDRGRGPSLSYGAELLWAGKTLPDPSLRTSTAAQTSLEPLVYALD